MRCHTEFGMLVHLVRTDLNLQRAAILRRYRRMQRAIVVAFGVRNIVIELATDWLP